MRSDEYANSLEGPNCTAPRIDKELRGLAREYLQQIERSMNRQASFRKPFLDLNANANADESTDSREAE